MPAVNSSEDFFVLFLRALSHVTDRREGECGEQTSMELNNKLRAVDEQMSVSPAYLSKVSIQERQSRWGEATDWVAQGGTGDEMLVCEGEKPPGFRIPAGL